MIGPPIISSLSKSIMQKDSRAMILRIMNDLAFTSNQVLVYGLTRQPDQCLIIKKEPWGSSYICNYLVSLIINFKFLQKLTCLFCRSEFKNLGFAIAADWRCKVADHIGSREDVRRRSYGQQTSGLAGFAFFVD